MKLNLIANSGIQFHKFELAFDANETILKSIGFREYFHVGDRKVTLELATFIPDHECWVTRQSLINAGYLNDDGSLKDRIKIHGIKQLDDETELFTVGNIDTALQFFEGKWIPIPYFKVNASGRCMFSPINWARLLLIPRNNGNSNIKKYDAVIAFDTQLSKSPGNYDSPVLSPNEEDNSYKLCDNEDLILNYCDANLDCGWVDDYLATLFHGGKSKIPLNFPSLKYLGHYVYFVKFIGRLGVFPEIEIYPDTKASIDVELVLDIGNANTCGILFESPDDNNFEFTSVKKLKIQDLTNLDRSYSDSFSMQLVFSKCNFGNIGYNVEKFQWPSILRIGEEASFLINDSLIDIERGIETSTYHSSPKRYLWDNQKREIQWEFARTAGQKVPTPVYMRGISEQFHSDGKFTLSSDFGPTSNFSRRSLMTFVFIEILAHALCQINSHEFRTDHGDFTRPRRLRRLLVTCPTAMLQREQVALRQAAEEAVIALNRFTNKTYDIEIDFEEISKTIDVIPSVRDLTKNISDLSSRHDWIYDEATCCQLVYMYAEVSKRYLNESDIYFDLYGKYRTDLEGYDKKSVTIASIDIGGGTTDLMICTYMYNYTSDMTEIIPKPLYWESFNLAGDDFLQQIIQQIILEGRILTNEDDGCVGVIENHGRWLGIHDILDRLNNFFGTDNNSFNYKKRIMRKNFNTQVLVPVAKKYLEHARQSDLDLTVDFNAIFTDLKPNIDVLDYFAAHFGFRFEEIRWKLSRRKVNSVLESTFEPLLKQLATLAYAHGADIVLLAGKPTSLERVEELFLKFYPVRPDRIITLNKYRVGRWYPFSDDSGCFDDPKTIVSVGALIGFMGGRNNKLSGFKINKEYLKKKIISTADYFGVYNKRNRNIERIFFTPNEQRADIEVNGLPVMLGFKQLGSEKYPGRLAYVLDFNTRKMAEKIRDQNPEMAENELADKIQNDKLKLRNRMPFKVRLRREYKENKEKIEVESILDKDRNDVTSSLVSLSLQTLEDTTGYWLDTGEFRLRIRD